MDWSRLNWRNLRLRLHALFFRSRVEQDLDEEVRFHLEMEARKHAAHGMPNAEAVRRAHIEFGSTVQVQEESRGIRGIQFVEGFWQDLRYAWRSFRHAPSFVATVTGTIALGIGLNAALFTVFDAHYLRPIEVRDPYSLYEVFWIDRAGGVRDFSQVEYEEFLAQTSGFSEAIAYQRVEARLNGKHLLGIAVTGNYFPMLGVKPVLGRTLVPADAAKPGETPVVVLSYSAWQSHFAGDSNTIGRKILLHGHAFEVVGVAPREFTGLGSRPTDFWTPLTMASFFDAGTAPADAARAASLTIVGRLRTGYTIRQAETGVLLWAQRFTSGLPAREQAVAAWTISRATRMPLNPKNFAAFSLVVVAFAVILLIACTNVSSMMLARACTRQHEIGVRLSLGASRGRLIRQFLTESMLLMLPSGVAGLLASQLILRSGLWVLSSTMPVGIAGFLSRIPSLSPDIRVLGFSLAVAFLAALICGLAPALQATRTRLTRPSHGDFNNDWRPSQVRNALLGFQIVVCVLMLITAGLLLRGIRGVQRMNAIFSARGVIQVSIQENSRQMVLNRFLREPTLETLAAATRAPVDRKPIAVVRPAGSLSLVSIAANRVSPEYFQLFELSVLGGRNFTAQEARRSAPVALVSETAATRLWPNEAVLGKQLNLTDDRGAATEFRSNQTVTVIGVVRDELSRWVTQGESKAIVYFPISAESVGAQLFLSVHGDAGATRNALDAELSGMDPNAIEQIQGLEIRQWVSEEAYSLRVLYWLSAMLGIMGLLLTFAGVYGVVSYAASQRTKEIGIRMALGATVAAVTQLMLLQSARLASVGGAIGCLLAFVIGKVLPASLGMIDAFNLFVYAGGLFAVWLACGLAAYMPARHAARLDPLVTLRCD
jgi:predicted permease